MRSPARLVIGLATLALSTGCGSPPQQEIDAAKAALESARSQAAQEYAPDALKAAEDAYADLEAELAAQNEKFALLRSYKTAAEKASAAAQAAQSAATAATAAKEQAKNDATAAIAAARISLQETMTMLEGAPRGKGSAVDLAAMKTDLESVDATLGEADGLIASEKYLEAMAKVETSNAAIQGVRTQVEAAMAKVAKPR
jgi:hypothetical protein